MSMSGHEPGEGTLARIGADSNDETPGTVYGYPLLCEKSITYKEKKEVTKWQNRRSESD